MTVSVCIIGLHENLFTHLPQVEVMSLNNFCYQKYLCD